MMILINTFKPPKCSLPVYKFFVFHLSPFQRLLNPTSFHNKSPLTASLKTFNRHKSPYQNLTDSFISRFHFSSLKKFTHQTLWETFQLFKSRFSKKIPKEIIKLRQSRKLSQKLWYDFFMSKISIFNMSIKVRTNLFSSFIAETYDRLYCFLFSFLVFMGFASLISREEEKRIFRQQKYLANISRLCVRESQKKFRSLTVDD